MENGLNDNIVRCIGQDKYGYIWIGNVGALCRFDGKNVKQFTNIPGDTTSPYSSQPRSICSDAKGRLWIGTETGLMEYDFNTSVFLKTPAIKGAYVFKVVSAEDSLLFVATRRGLIRYNTLTGASFNYSTSGNPAYALLQSNPVNDIHVKGDTLFMATNRGLVTMNYKSNKPYLIDIPQMKNMGIFTIALDKKNNIWLGTHQRVKLAKLHPDYKTLDIYDRFLSADLNTQPLNIMDILADSKGRVWVVTVIDGLLQYDESTDSFIRHLHNKYILSSPAGNNYRCLFQDDKGMIWLGCDNDGVNFFNPDKNMFQTILPFPDRLDERGRNVGRGITEDKDGNIWMGTHDGVTKLDIKTGVYTIWRNDENKTPVIYNNVVRSMVCDGENNIWIGTADGVNFFNAKTKKMEFISGQYLPRSFYNSVNKDRNGNIWFSTNDTSTVYWYDRSEKKFDNISNHPALKKYIKYTPASYVMEDSKNRIWISFSRKGVVMYDKRTKLLKQYMASDSNINNSIIGNQVVDIKEDKKGVIWVSTFNGISGIDTEKDSVISFNDRNGLAGNWVSPIAIDNLNRIWIGVNGALMMLDSDRKQFTSFTLDDGLSSVAFPEHAGIQAANGDIIFPSNNGFIRFNPADFKEEKTMFNFYVSGYSVFDKNFYNIRENEINPVLHFKSYENTFTFNLVALNYYNPGQTWFAYKLEEFEENWHFTKDPKAVYTNVPGDKYKFLYKASAGNTQWDTLTAKQITVVVKTVFYKTIWFWVLIALFSATILFIIYQYRLRQQKEVFMLKEKAQLLEKEKALVMYENLKQQLNPHFLFNSLTSLSSLIRLDQEIAGNFLDKMSKVYRYILKNRDNETVPLGEELKFVQLYIDLQKTRFEKGLIVNVNIDGEYHHRKIAPVTLQNLVENAIKHNTADPEAPLIIDLFIQDDYLVVRNNLQRKNFVETSNKQGLANMESLYHYLSDRPMEIREDEKFFTIKIPLI